MISTTRLKIWTVISHSCILIGIGHGIAILGLAEFFWLSTIFESKRPTGGEGHIADYSFQLIAVMCLVGQIAIFTSIVLKYYPFNKWMHIGGLGMLWASVITYAYVIRNVDYAHLAVLSCLPLIYCTVKTLLSGHIQLLWKKIDAKI